MSYSFYTRVIEGEMPTRRPIYAWDKGVNVDPNAMDQLRNVASLPFIHHHVAAMPDVHWGIGATVGSVIPTLGAVIPAAVGVDIGCGMAATRLAGITTEHLPHNLRPIRDAIENAVPVGFASHPDGRWGLSPLHQRCSGFLEWLDERHPKVRAPKRKRTLEETICSQFGTLGGGNHFIELCTDEEDGVWVMLHSGSRGIGNRLGMYFIELAREDMRSWHINLPDVDLAYFPEGTDHFNDYLHAVLWAQQYARDNRRQMMELTLDSLQRLLPPFTTTELAVECHHNYVDRENHYGQNVLVTRKGAVRARKGDLGIIPGSMGTQSYIVRGLGNPASFDSCSHGAGRVMSRTQAKKTISVADHEAATAGVECRKDSGVLDESPAAYKSIDAVMAAQEDLVEIVHTLKQVVCVKG